MCYVVLTYDLQDNEIVQTDEYVSIYVVFVENLAFLSKMYYVKKKKTKIIMAPIIRRTEE